MRLFLLPLLLGGCGLSVCGETDTLYGAVVRVVDDAGEPVPFALVNARLEGDEFHPCEPDGAGRWGCEDRQGPYDIRVETPGFDPVEATALVTGGRCDNDIVRVTVTPGPTCTSYLGPQVSVAVTVDGGPAPDGAVVTWSYGALGPQECSPGDVATMCGVDVVGPVAVSVVAGDQNANTTVDVPMDGCNAVTQSADLTLR